MSIKIKVLLIWVYFFFNLCVIINATTVQLNVVKTCECYYSAIYSNTAIIEQFTGDVIANIPLQNMLNFEVVSSCFNNINLSGINNGFIDISNGNYVQYVIVQRNGFNLCQYGGQLVNGAIFCGVTFNVNNNLLNLSGLSNTLIC